MAEFLSQRVTARLGVLLFVLSGLLTIANSALPSPTPRNILALVAIGGSAMVTGTIIWFLPWQRWHRNATLPLVPLAFVMIALGGMASLRPWSYAVYWVVAFVWLGAAHPRWTSVDAVARFGGEEFLVVLRAAGEDIARAAVERLAEGWRRTDPLVTFSAGIAVHTNNRTPLESLAAADTALYSAKAAGRNFVRVYADEGVPPEVMAR